MDKESLYSFPNDFPYEFASTDDEQIAGLTRHLSRYVSLQEQLCFSYKEPTLGRSGYSHSQAPSPSFTYKGGEGAWNLVYAATGKLARMKIIMSNLDVTGVPHAFNRPHLSSWGRSEGIELRPHQHFCGNRSVYAWHPSQVQTQRHQHRPNQRKPIVGTHAKRECAGTGVFLPRRYCDNSPEYRTPQAISPSNPPAEMIKSSAKSFIVNTPPQIQTHINSGFVSQYELCIDRSKAMILAAQQQRRRSNIHGVVMESAVNNPAVLLPQEWTY